MCNAQHHSLVIPSAHSLYDAALDIEILKTSCFSQANKVQFLFVDSGNAFSPDKKAAFIVCYDRAHALVLVPDKSKRVFVLFDSLQNSELCRHLIEKGLAVPIQSAADAAASKLGVADLDASQVFIHSGVQLDTTSCIYFSLLYIHLRKTVDHTTAVRKLQLLKHRQVREFGFILLGIINEVIIL